MCLGKGRAAGCVSHASNDAMRHQRVGALIEVGITCSRVDTFRATAPFQPGH
jgi:hypothetical protein